MASLYCEVLGGFFLSPLAVGFWAADALRSGDSDLCKEKRITKIL